MKKAQGTGLAIFFSIATIVVILGIAYWENEKNKENTNAITGELTDTKNQIKDLIKEVNSLKEAKPVIELFVTETNDIRKDILDVNIARSNKNPESKFNIVRANDFLDGDGIYKETIIVIKNFGKKTEGLRVKFECSGWEYYAVAFENTLTLEQNFRKYGIIFRIPELDEIKGQGFFFYYKSDGTVTCDVEYTSEDIDKTETKISF